MQFYVHQFNTPSISQYAYYVDSKNEALIVDPVRDIDQYLETLSQRKSKLKYIFLTHFHADFVSGHVELAKQTGATIVLGPNAVADFKFKEAKDNERFQIGDLKLKVIHTPGHTPESSCFVLKNNEGHKHCIFTGDTLFLGDVGRPDLATSEAKHITKEDLAALLFDSLKKFKDVKEYPDDLIVYPGHGAGSPCGKDLSNANSCVMKNQRKNNYAMVIDKKEEFVKSLIHNLPDPPQYFFFDAKLNKSKDIEGFNKVVSKNFKPIKPDNFNSIQAKGDNLILDTRDHQTVLNEGFISGSINISLIERFEIWTGTLIAPMRRLLLLNSISHDQDVIKKLAMIGYDNVEGFLEGGFDAWKSKNFPITKMNTIKHEDVPKFLNKPKSIILDVRERPEWEQGVLPNSMFITIRTLEKNLQNVPKDKDVYTLCRGGVRSQMAATILMKHGFKNIINLEGGMLKILEKGVKLIPK